MTLSELSYQLRQVGKLLAVFLLVVGLLLMLGLMLILSTRSENKTELKIDPKFNKIPAPIFEEALSRKPSKYILNTVEGELPIATTSAQVYFIPQKETLLSAKKKILNFAQSLGFATDNLKYEQVDERTVRLEDETKALIINTNTFFFNFSYKSSQPLQEILTATPEADFNYLETAIEQQAKNFLSEQNLYYTWLASGKTNKVYEKYDLASSNFIATSPEETSQALRIDFFRKDEDLPVVAPQYFLSQNYLIFSPLVEEAKLVTANFASFEKLELEPGVYPLLTTDEAWQKLNKGEAKTIAWDQNATEVKIQQIFVAYYDPNTYQQYFQPIFVFLGDNNYVSYLPAIRDEYLLR
jgi:hypothetical protein